MNPLSDPTAVYGAIFISLFAILTWGLLFVRMAWAFARRRERRALLLAMPIVGLLACMGTLSSAIGFGISSGVLHIDISRDALTLVASMGRGGLMMGGVIALAYYRPSD